MTSPLFWVTSVPVKHLTNEQRLAQALDAAAMKPGVLRDVVRVHPRTVVETRAPEGVLLIGDTGLREGFDFRFVRELAVDQ